MPQPVDIGRLAQEVLNAFNRLSQLRNSGAGPLAIKTAEQALREAQAAQQAATGSQQGLGRLVGRGIAASAGSSIMPAFGPPQMTVEQGVALGNKGGTAWQGSPMNFGPLGRLFARIAPSIFGQTGLRAPTSFSPTNSLSVESIRNRTTSTPLVAPNSFFPRRPGIQAPTQPALIPVKRTPKYPLNNRRY